MRAPNNNKKMCAITAAVQCKDSSNCRECKLGQTIDSCTGSWCTGKWLPCGLMFYHGSWCSDKVRGGRELNTSINSGQALDTTLEGAVYKSAEIFCSSAGKYRGQMKKKKKKKKKKKNTAHLRAPTSTHRRTDAHHVRTHACTQTDMPYMFTWSIPTTIMWVTESKELLASISSFSRMPLVQKVSKDLPDILHKRKENVGKHGMSRRTTLLASEGY